MPAGSRADDARTQGVGFLRGVRLPRATGSRQQAAIGSIRTISPSCWPSPGRVPGRTQPVLSCIACATSSSPDARFAPPLRSANVRLCPRREPLPGVALARAAAALEACRPGQVADACCWGGRSIFPRPLVLPPVADPRRCTGTPHARRQGATAGTLSDALRNLLAHGGR